MHHVTGRRHLGLNLGDLLGHHLVRVAANKVHYVLSLSAILNVILVARYGSHLAAMRQKISKPVFISHILIGWFDPTCLKAAI